MSMEIQDKNSTSVTREKEDPTKILLLHHRQKSYQCNIVEEEIIVVVVVEANQVEI